MGLVTIVDIAEMCKVSVRTIRNWRRNDATFPEPLNLPGRTARWVLGDVEVWLEAKRERVG